MSDEEARRHESNKLFKNELAELSKFYDDGKIYDYNQIERVPVYGHNFKRCKHPKTRKLAGCEDCPDWSRCDHEKVRY